MTKKKLGRVLLMLAALFVAGGFFNGTKRAPVAEAAVTGYGTPTPDISSFLFWYTGTGFRLQPQDEYTAAGTSKTLTTGVGYSFMDTWFNALAYNHFQWYQSTDSGASWQSIKGATSSSLTVTPTTPGTTYYQERFGYYLFIPPFTQSMYYYSRVASVTALGDPVNATSLSVKADDNYLYNNQDNAATTNVHATPTPANATGSVTWSSSNPSLASVDKDDGTVTANKDGKSGTVTITGTIKNDDGTTKSGSVDIKIGGGLDDQTVDVGKTATFKVQGTFPSAPKSVVWYRKAPGSSTATKVASGTSLTYTTPTTTSADDGASYYAEVTIASGTDSKTITTNTANLNVMFSTSPRVSITSKITDLTDNTGNTDTYLSNIVAGDNVEVSGTITDSNPDSTLQGGVLKIKVPENITNTYFTIDGQDVHNTAKLEDDGYYYLEQGTALTSDRIDFSSQQTHKYKIDFQSLETTNTDFTTNVKVDGYDNTTGGNLLDTYQSQNLSMNFSANTLTAKAGNVTFGSLSYANVNQDIEGQVEGGGDLLAISDDRRTKTGTTITLSQATPFRTSDGSHTLDATLSYSNGSSAMPLTDKAQTVQYSGPGIKVGSLSSDHGQKLLLNMASQAIYTGSYSSTLDWTITMAPS
jgi:hypothetical protein